MGGHMALDEEGVLLRIQTAGHILGQLLQGPPAQQSRIVACGEGMEIRHEIVAVILLGPFGPVLDGAQVGAQGQIAGGLDAREHDFFGRSGIFHKNTSFSDRLSSKWYCTKRSSS